MLILQHIWSRWTKESRGANARRPRPRLEEAYAFPEIEAGGDVWCHEIHSVGEEDFAVEQSLDPIVGDEWRHWRPHRATPLAWHLHKDAADIRLANPSQHRLRTKWPAFLPSPLFTLRPGETARIDWNGRLRMSMGGSDRSYYYEQHTYWLALAEAPGPRLFLDARPKKHIDLRTEIY
ncbi:MAG: hypothetical protein QOG72_506 [Sphingomonadales bacterium]|jgi:hypothetical protein|nr:hypothetical protein [Sphingomonadales bacterium]